MIVLALSLVLLYLFYRWATNNDNKWDGTGVKVIKPKIPLLGSDPMMFINMQPLPELIKKNYRKYKEYPYYVMYFLKDDIVQVHDLDVIKDICIRNFDHFTDRLVVDAIMETHPDQRRFLNNMKGEEWKILRNSLSPTFTAGKLRNIVGAMESCSPTFTDYIRTELDKNKDKPLQMLNTFKKYTMSVIGNGVFGVDAEAYDEKESEFVKAAKEFIINFDLRTISRTIFLVSFPKFCKFIGFRLVKENSYFRKLTRVAMAHRKEQDYQRNDMLKLLIDLQDSAKENKPDPGNIDTTNAEEDTQFEKDARLSGVTKAAVIDEDTVTQSAVLFLFAGIDTTAHTLSMATYHLAMNPEIQEKVRESADSIAATLENNQITYDDVKKMEYIDMIVAETLRITPIVPVLERVCTKDYKLPCGAIIPKGTRINFPIAGIHNDERYWEKPEVFCPERFSPENKSNITHGAYLPFGVGPRNCIGMRFALLEVKIALYNILRNFIMKPSEKSPKPLRFTRGTVFTDVEGSNWLHLVPREEIN